MYIVNVSMTQIKTQFVTKYGKVNSVIRIIG